ncbi:MAG: hypothetical protein IKA31_01735, partial [Clostridia bacterium]|nr:hypothetical protein [Clostridia bacterium]
MFYKKGLVVKNSKTYKITYNAFANGMTTELDDNLQNHKIAKLTYNFTSKNGALKSGLGFKKLCFPNGLGEEIEMNPPKYEILKTWHFKNYNHVQDTRRDMFIVLCDDKYLYWTLIESQDPNFYMLNTKKQESTPNVIGYRLNGEDSIIITSTTNEMQVVSPSGDVETFDNAPKFIAVCIHNERLFAITEGERSRLMFSANLDPTNWNLDIDEAGFIDMLDERGSMNNVISFKDYVYVIRDYGISRVSAYADQTEFMVTQLFNSSVKIYADSVAVCGEKMLFLAQNGIYVFDGYSTKKLDLPITDIFAKDNSKAVGAFYNGKYYLALKIDFDDDIVGAESSLSFVNNALIELDLDDYSYSILRGVDILSMLTIKHENCNKLVANFRGDNCLKLGELTQETSMVFYENLPKKWVSPKSNLGFANKLKIIKEITLLSKGDISITIATDKETKT